MALTEAQLLQRRNANAKAAAKARAKTHCKNGHEFTPENTRIKTDGRRQCITCHRDATYYYYKHLQHALKRDRKDPRHGTSLGAYASCRCVRCRLVKQKLAKEYYIRKRKKREG